jgi:hypothetical protein
MTDRFDCDVLGNMDEYVGCRRLERNVKECWIKFTQPVQLQSFVDESDLPDERDKPFIPAEAGQVMKRASENEGVGLDGQGAFRKGVGKLLHMMRWSRPDTLNAVRELSRNMMYATATHMKALYRVMKYCVTTKDRGLVLKPDRAWNGLPSHKFVIAGKADSKYASCPDIM